MLDRGRRRGREFSFSSRELAPGVVRPFCRGQGLELHCSSGLRIEYSSALEEGSRSDGGDSAAVASDRAGRGGARTYPSLVFMFLGAMCRTNWETRGCVKRVASELPSATPLTCTDMA